KGPIALPFLRAAKGSQDPEVSRRADECVEAISKGFTPFILGAAARTLAARQPEGAAAALLEFLPANDDEAVADEVRNALVKLAPKDGKGEAAVVAALPDKSSARRAAAGYALARCGSVQDLPSVRKLLDDAEPAVRLHVGLALAANRDKEAFPAL